MNHQVVFFLRSSGLYAKLHVPVIGCAWILSGHWQLYAQQTSPDFTPPRAHDVTRYEAGWLRNPFSLRTAPAPSGGVFAGDMAIGSYYGSQEHPTVVLVNTKTHERLRLKLGETSRTGITLEKVTLGDRRSDCVVEVRGSSGHTALLKFDEAYLRQQAANATRNVPASAPPVPPQSPGAQAPPAAARPLVQSASNTSPKNAPAGTDGSRAALPEALRGIVPPSAFAAAPVLANASSSSQAPQQSSPPPRPQRRRSITAIGQIR